MIKEKYKELCGKINYNTYTETKKVLWRIYFSLLLYSEIEGLPMPLDALMLSEGLLCIFLEFSHGKYYTKDVKEIEKLYEEFINNYKKLNNTLELKNPIEISTMLHELTFNGYLSKDKNFEFSSSQAREICNRLTATNVFTGKAVCRHISRMLEDTLIALGIEAKQLGVYSRDERYIINIIQEQIKSKEEIIDYIMKYTNKNDQKNLIKVTNIAYENNKGIEILTEQIEDKSKLKRICGNHVITFASKDGFSYFLDPTNDDVLRKDNNDPVLNNYLFKIPIKKIGTLVINNNLKEYLSIQKELKKDHSLISLEEQEKIISDTKLKYKNNLDIFEKFYNDNSEIYNETTDKLLKIKKRKFRGI